MQSPSSWKVAHAPRRLTRTDHVTYRSKRFLGFGSTPNIKQGCPHVSEHTHDINKLKASLPVAGNTGDRRQPRRDGVLQAGHAAVELLSVWTTERRAACSYQQHACIARVSAALLANALGLWTAVTVAAVHGVKNPKWPLQRDSMIPSAYDPLAFCAQSATNPPVFCSCCRYRLAALPRLA